MANAATMATPPAPAKEKAGKQGPPQRLVPFTRAAKPHIEPFVDVSQIITSNAVALGPYDVPAYGYLQNIVLLAEATGGVASVTVAAQEDAPFIALQEIQLADVNGAPIWGPCSGYDLYLHNKYGGYEFSTEPKLNSSFSAVAVGASASGNFAFSLKIPVELNVRDALGCLANQNASSTYKLKVTLASSATIYSTAPNTTLPTVRLRAYLEAWAQPPSEDLRGRPQQTAPPAHGTTQYFSKSTSTVPAAATTLRLTRMGNYVRNVIFVNRRSSSTRANGNTDWPDPIQTFWDSRLLDNLTKIVWRDRIKYRTGYTATIETANGQDNGVFVWDFCHEFDGKIGHEIRDGWLPTLQSTRVEINGTWGSACSVDILTNDVAPAGEVFM